jgi:serine/threonine-protein kinase PknG
VKCQQPGCTGKIVDGYCDVCGMPGAPSLAPSQAKPGSRPSHQATGKCPQPGCPGKIIDGYCDVCGAPPVQPKAAPRAPESQSAATKASAALGSLAFGSTRATSFGSRIKRRKTASKVVSRMGVGLTTVPPAPTIDPAKAIMKNPVVPEKRRVCPKCGAKVGRSAEDVKGRSEGFCPQCQAPYNFSVKLKAGDVVAGQYQIVGALAHGGQGWIYLGRDRNVSGRWVVLKGLLNAGDSDAVAAAIAEQQFLARVGVHPQIVEIYNFVTDQDAGYIVMEYVGGRSLKQLLQQRMEANNGVYDPLPPDQALAFLIEILPALDYMHDIGLLYCDFKPDNVIQTGDSLKVIDLGGVRHANDDESPIFGTVGYQAPEVAVEGASVASDIYTVGRTLMVLCADVPGYQTKYVSSIPPAAEMPAFAANDSLYRLLLRCCATAPDDRFTSIEELRRQMIGVLREVVSTASGKVATTASASQSFQHPAGIGEKPSWEQLPGLYVDEDDPSTGWLSQVDFSDPQAALNALAKAPQQSPEVQLAKARSALAADNAQLADQVVQQMLTDDPWEWRAVWMAGLSAMRAERYSDAQACFNAVYGQLPGELAPKLALALACELGNEAELAEQLYRVCYSSDASYVTMAAFGIARIRAARKDLKGILAALNLVPTTSRGYPEAVRMKAHYLAALNTDAKQFDTVMRAIEAAPFDEKTKAAYRSSLLKQAIATGKPQVLGGKQLSRVAMRRELEKSLRRQAALTNVPVERAIYIDQANQLRPWSAI